MAGDICDACNTNKSVGVASAPGVPMSVAYCQECLDANSHLMDILVANTACIGGLDYSAPWWKRVVDTSLARQGKTMEWFNEQVHAVIEQLSRIEGG